MCRIRKVIATTACFLVLTLALPGCNTSITPDTTLGELLDQITVGDVVAAFQQFTAGTQFGPGGFGGGPAGFALSSEQLGQIEALQAQLTAGEITREAFQTQVQAIIGDAAPNMAFAGFGFSGTPFGFGQHLDTAAPLDLTDEQREQAREIFGRLHDDIRALRDQAHEDIRAVLTDEQRAILDEMQAGRGFGVFGPPADMFGMMMSQRHGSGRPFFGRLSEALDLTDEQQELIETIREALRDAIEARHQQARDEFQAILTPEQLALLDAMETDG